MATKLTNQNPAPGPGSTGSDCNLDSCMVPHDGNSLEKLPKRCCARMRKTRKDLMFQKASSHHQGRTTCGRPRLKSCTEDLLEDQFENVVYDTFRNACVTKLNFVSVGFFTVFYNKMMADFSKSVTTDSNNIDVCTTHVKGQKCGIRIDK